VIRENTTDYPPAESLPDPIMTIPQNRQVPFIGIQTIAIPVKADSLKLVLLDRISRRPQPTKLGGDLLIDAAMFRGLPSNKLPLSS